MTSLAWWCVAVWLVLAGGLIGVGVYDVHAVSVRKPTLLSQACLYGAENPWAVAVFTAAGTLPLGILIGHLKTQGK